MTESRDRESISVFFPAYNDAGSIATLVRDALALLPSLADDYEVIVVNDGSTDETHAVLDELARTLPRVRVIHHERNRGYGGALRTGLASARKELETPVNHYPRRHGRSQFFALRPVARTAFDFFSLWLRLVVFRR
ncbi:MAG: glycosyltransferase family 2 protein [Acidobacteria bacterium]|nr:glycosyltransferase family 2 protein [Acidobacteriota bacterium]